MLRIESLCVKLHIWNLEYEDEKKCLQTWTLALRC